MPPPQEPKVYHIIHVDRLASVIGDAGLLSDAVMAGRENVGTTIGMSNIKQRRLNELSLKCHQGLRVGACVPFYFCPRSVMLYVIHQANAAELAYRGGQGPIVHLEADLRRAVAWANENNKRWAFTLSNAGSRYFEDRADLAQLPEINWDAVQTNKWSGAGVSGLVKEGKQAEFLLEESFPWTLIERIGVRSLAIHNQVVGIIQNAAHKPAVQIMPQWYY